MKKIILFIKTYERPIKTFIEAYCSYITVNIAMTDFESISAIKGLLIGGFASAISIVLNARNKKED